MNEAAFTISSLRILKDLNFEHFSDFKSRALQRPKTSFLVTLKVELFRDLKSRAF